MTTSPSTSPAPRPEDENLGLGANLAYGLQHVLTMYGGIVAVPLILGQAAGLAPAEIGLLIAASLFAGGLATLLQTLGLPFFGCQLPLVQGVSFAGVATMGAILGSQGGGGLPAVLGAVMAASLIGFLITPVFSRITKFFPPLVTGIVITTIGLTLMPVAARWVMGGNSASPEFGSMANIGLAALTFAIVLLLSKLGSASISRLSILLAMVAGTLIAWSLGMADFSKVTEGPIFAFPTPFHFGMPTFHIAAILSMCIVIMVTLVETSADILAVGEIIDTKVDSKRLGNGLRADMASSILAPIFGSFTQSAFAQNVGLVAVTGVKSRYVVATGGVILVVLGLLPIMGRVIAAVPTPVLGGRRYRAVWHRGCQRHPHPVESQLQEQRQPDHRRRLAGLRHDPDRGAELLPQLPQLVRNHLPLRHQLGGDHGNPAEPDVQPLHHRQLGKPVGVRRGLRAHHPVLRHLGPA
ncbi:xanthine permease [Pseudomonas hunanensis]|nr:xanthine permease [Pseudomonas hunanensis]